MYQDERIDYTKYLRDRPQETDPVKIGAMDTILRGALKRRGVNGPFSAVYYADGHVKVSVNGEFYGMFDPHTRRFFSGYVGDYQEGGQT